MVAGVLTLLILGAGGAVAEGAAQERRPPPAALEVLLEAGVAIPRGDLTGEYGTDLAAANARAGYDLGFRVRFFVGPKLAIAPAFHYAKFRSLETELADGEPFSVGTALVVGSFDFQYYLRGRRPGFAPFLSVGLGLAQNRYQETLGEDDKRDASVNAPLLQFGAGFRLGSFEFSVEYRFDRFETIRFVPTDTVTDYDWDSVAARVGWLFPSP